MTKLLNPQVVNVKLKQQADFKKQQDKLLDEEIAKKIRQLNDLPALYEKKKLEMESAFNDLFKSLSEKLQHLKDDVKILEDRLFEESKPLAEKEVYLKNWESILNVREKTHQDQLIDLTVRETDLESQTRAVKAAYVNNERIRLQLESDRLKLDPDLKALNIRRGKLDRDAEDFNKLVSLKTFEIENKQKQLAVWEESLRLERVRLEKLQSELNHERLVIAARRNELELAADYVRKLKEQNHVEST